MSRDRVTSGTPVARRDHRRLRGSPKGGSGDRAAGEAPMAQGDEQASREEPAITEHSFRYVSELGGFHRGGGRVSPSDMEFPPDEMAKIPTWEELLKWLRRRYDGKRDQVRSGRRINARPRVGGQFVAVDSEGLNIGEPFVHGEAKYQRQRTCLWMAGGAEGFANQSITDVNGLSSAAIFEFLLSLPRRFAAPDSDAPAPIFVSFGFTYDVAQLIADFPFEKGWELHNGKPWSKRNDKDVEENYRRWVLWKGYGISNIAGKSVTLCKLRNRDQPFRDGTHDVDWIERIEIYDTFGFFGKSFLGAIAEMPGVVTADELAIIKAGKGERGSFKAENIETIEEYTSLELKALVCMMTKLRTSLKVAIPGRPIELTNWWGAGAIAKALLKSYLGDRPRAILGDVEQDTEWRRWAFHAYFGGRIELMQQGKHTGWVFENDVSSAYPANAAQLPTMKGGEWVFKVSPTREDLEHADMLSMFHVRTYAVERDLPFYPLPFRTEHGSIMFPASVDGYYMRDDVLAALKWFEEFERQKRLSHYGRNPKGAVLEISEGWLFMPASDEKPLAWIKDLFDYRASLPKGDIRGDVIKLGINSIYGKFAQRVGRRGQPPKFASPWYAAAITAGTRRKLIEAALCDPDYIIGFATDGIFSTKRLDVYVPPTKQLGEWELKVAKEGASFVQAGIRSVHEDDELGEKGVKIASRGFSPQNTARDAGLSAKKALDIELYENIPQFWRDGKPSYPFRNQQYMTLGACVVSRHLWPLIGCWKIGPRELQLDKMSQKRIVPKSERLRKMRASKLVPLEVNHLRDMTTMSAPSFPKWLSPKTKVARALDEDAENVVAGLSF